MNTMLFYEFRSEKQAQALEVTFSRKTKSYNSQTCFNNILRIYLNEKSNFYHRVIERTAQMHIRSENLFNQTIFLLVLKYNENHQYKTQQTEMLQYFIAELTFF